MFFATDKHHQPVEELAKDDFAVIDDERVIRDFRSFSRADLTKLDVVVLMDSSDSVLPRFRPQMADVLQLITQWPWNQDDNLSIMSFSGLEPHLLCDGNCRNWFDADRVALPPGGGETPLFDALDVAANALIERRQPDIWQVIILFSDGQDTISKHSYADAKEKLLENGVLVYTVDVSEASQPSYGIATLRKIADDSGGRCLSIAEGVDTILNDVINDLESARVVTYIAPQSSADFHAIRILPTRNLNLQFRSRRGYYHHSGGAR